MDLGSLIVELMLFFICFSPLYLICKLINAVIKGPKKFTVDGIPIIPYDAVKYPSLDEPIEEKKINVNVEKIFEDTLQRDLDKNDMLAKIREKKEEKLELLFSFLKENEDYLRSNSNLPINFYDRGDYINIEIIEVTQQEKNKEYRTYYSLNVSIEANGSFSVRVVYHNESLKADRMEGSEKFDNNEDTVIYIIKKLAQISSSYYKPIQL
jgi:hypothetical protein